MKYLILLLLVSCATDPKRYCIRRTHGEVIKTKHSWKFIKPKCLKWNIDERVF